MSFIPVASLDKCRGFCQEGCSMYAITTMPITSSWCMIRCGDSSREKAKGKEEDYQPDLKKTIFFIIWEPFLIDKTRWKQYSNWSFAKKIYFSELEQVKSQKKTQKLRKLQEQLHCFAYNGSQLKFPLRRCGAKFSWGLNSQSQERTLRLHGKRGLFVVKLPGYCYQL